MYALSPLETLATGGGRVTAGESAGRAVLAVPLDAELWEIHDKPWDVSDEDECNDSYWPPDEGLAAMWSKLAIQWVEPDDLIEFVRAHWPEFDAESITAKRLSDS